MMCQRFTMRDELPTATVSTKHSPLNVLQMTAAWVG